MPEAENSLETLQTLRGMPLTATPRFPSTAATAPPEGAGAALPDEILARCLPFYQSTAGKK